MVHMVYNGISQGNSLDFAIIARLYIIEYHNLASPAFGLHLINTDYHKRLLADLHLSFHLSVTMPMITNGYASSEHY